MAYEGILQCIPGLKASADLSAKQFTAMKLSGNLSVVDADAGEASVGILQNNPISGEAATVAYLGVSKAILGDTVAAAGTRLASDVDGKLVPATLGSYVVAIALEAGALNDLRSVLVLPGSEPIA